MLHFIVTYGVVAVLMGALGRISVSMSSTTAD